MNIKLVIILSMIFMHQNVFSQSGELSKTGTDKTAETYLNPVLNLVRTNLHYGNSENTLADYKKPLMGLQVGLSMQAGITPNFSLVPELYFIMRGGKLGSNNPMTLGKTTLRVHSLESPLLARFHFHNIHVNAGPSVTYNFDGNIKVEGASNGSANDYKHWEAGAQFGGGYSFRIKGRRLALDLRYNYGLTNISKTNKMYNRSLILSVLFSKPLKTNPLAGKGN